MLAGVRLPSIVIRARYLLLVAWGLAWLPHARHRSGPLTDWGLFVYAGRALTGHPAHYTGGPLRLYVEIPGLQLGAPPLLLTRAFDATFGLASATAATVAAALIAVAIVWMCEDAGRHIKWEPARLVAFLAGIFVVPAMVEGVGAYGHLDDVLTLTAIVATAVALARQWPAWTVGALLGLAVVCKPWALVVVPVLFALPRVQWPPAVLALIAMVAVWWLPFVLAAPDTLHALGSLRLPVMSGSSLHALGYRPGHDAPGWVRPAQLVAGFAVAGFLVQHGRWYAAPLAGVAVRVLLDPAAWGYYGMGPVAAAALLDASGHRRLPLWTAAAALVEYAPWPSAAAAWLRLAWALGVVALLCLSFRATDRRVHA